MESEKMRCFLSWDFLPFKIVEYWNAKGLFRCGVCREKGENGSGFHLLMQLLLLSAVRYACLLFTQTEMA